MFGGLGVLGKKRLISLDDHLGRLVPPGSLTLARIERDLVGAVDRQRYLAGHGIPSLPTRFTVAMNPADRAWMAPESEDILARSVESYADRSGLLVVGPVEVSFYPDPLIHPGRTQVWAGFAEGDLSVLASPRAATEIFAAS